jgi:flagellar basal-body rod modification protein FlgD
MFNIAQPATATANAVASAAQPAAQSTADKAAITTETDFETFLKLLTTQMRNQDPLKPLDSTQFIAQLASFSSVEQQVNTNKNLEAIQTLLTGGAAGLAGWLGAEAQATMAAQWSGDPIEIETDPIADATRASLVVRDATGAAVHRATVDPTAQSLTWSGEGGTEGGLYRFELERWKGDDLLGSAAARVYAAVREVRVENGSPVLVFPGGVRVSETDVTALRAGQS